MKATRDNLKFFEKLKIQTLTNKGVFPDKARLYARLMVIHIVAHESKLEQLEGMVNYYHNSIGYFERKTRYTDFIRQDNRYYFQKRRLERFEKFIVTGRRPFQLSKVIEDVKSKIDNS